MALVDDDAVLADSGLGGIADHRPRVRDTEARQVGVLDLVANRERTADDIPLLGVPTPARRQRWGLRQGIQT